MFAPEIQTKQFIAEVNGAFNFRFRVFSTGSDRHYLFVCVQNPDFQFPVLKSHLRPEVRRALANGVGHEVRPGQQLERSTTSVCYRRSELTGYHSTFCAVYSLDEQGMPKPCDCGYVER